MFTILTRVSGAVSFSSPMLPLTGEEKETVSETRIEIVNVRKSCLDRDGDFDSDSALILIQIIFVQLMS